MNHNNANLLFPQTRIELRCFTHEIVDRASRFRARKSAARDHKCEPLTAHGWIVLQGRFFQKRHHAISQQRGVAKIFHCYRPIADAGVFEEVRLRTEREQQMIELEFELCTVQSMYAPNFSRVKIDI